MKPIEINSIDDLNASYQRIRNMKEGFVTNMFLNPYLANIWTKHKLLYKTSLDKTDFIVRKDNGFMHLYFCSASENSLESDLNIFNAGSNETYVIDIIGNQSQGNTLTEIMGNCGFMPYTNLQRMINENFNHNNFQIEVDPNLRIADKSDLAEIRSLIEEYFDKYSEQFPLYEELEKWSEKGSILIYNSGNSVQGFSISDINGCTSHLRYWLVLSSHRGSGIGSKLINRVFYSNPIIKRHILWVNIQNHNAIDKYIHYGFYKDGLLDQIFINKNIKNGTENN